ncbi:UNVERIFIED_ORG: hypothetical protein J2W85_002439 [Ensifer adhaerens]|nr:hypothetical protein [Ensifer adhaerens]
MSIFGIDIIVAGTIYILGKSLEDACAKFDTLVGKTFDATDRHWFSEASFDSEWMPEFSFARGHTTCGAVHSAPLKLYSEKQLRKAMRTKRAGRKEKLLPYSDRHDFERNGQRVYTCDVHIETMAFFTAASPRDAEGHLKKLDDRIMDWDFTTGWLYPEAIADPDFPFVVSPHFHLVGPIKGLELELHWSEEAEHTLVATNGGRLDAVDQQSVGETETDNRVEDEAGLLIAAARFKQCCLEWGGVFSSISDQDAIEIARFAKARLDKQVSASA